MEVMESGELDQPLDTLEPAQRWVWTAPAIFSWPLPGEYGGRILQTTGEP